MKYKLVGKVEKVVDVARMTKKEFLKQSVDFQDGCIGQYITSLDYKPVNNTDNWVVLSREHHNFIDVFCAEYGVVEGNGAKNLLAVFLNAYLRAER